MIQYKCGVGIKGIQVHRHLVYWRENRKRIQDCGEHEDDGGEREELENGGDGGVGADDYLIHHFLHDDGCDHP